MNLNIFLLVALLANVGTAHFYFATTNWQHKTMAEAEEDKKWSLISKALATHEGQQYMKDEWRTMLYAFETYMAQKTDVPTEVLEGTSIVTYTSEPAWFTAMPTEIRDPYRSFLIEEDKIRARVWNGSGSSAKNDRLTVYIGALIAILVTGVALL